MTPEQYIEMTLNLHIKLASADTFTRDELKAMGWAYYRDPSWEKGRVEEFNPRTHIRDELWRVRSAPRSWMTGTLTAGRNWTFEAVVPLDAPAGEGGRYASLLAWKDEMRALLKDTPELVGNSNAETIASLVMTEHWGPNHPDEPIRIFEDYAKAHILKRIAPEVSPKRTFQDVWGDKIIEWREEGRSYRWMAFRIGCNYRTVLRMKDKMGLDPDEEQAKQQPPEPTFASKVISWFKETGQSTEGLTPDQIGDLAMPFCRKERNPLTQEIQDAIVAELEGQHEQS